MKKLIFLSAVWAISTLLLPTSCKKNGIDGKKIDPSEQSVLQFHRDSTKFVNTPIVWMAPQSRFSIDFASRAIAVKGAVDENDLIIFTTLENLTSNIETVKKAYDNGAVVVFVNPQISSIVKFMRIHGWSHRYPTNNNPLFYAVSKRGAFSLREPLECEPEPICIEEEGQGGKESYSEKDAQGEYMDPFEDYDPSDPAYLVGGLVKWINGTVEPFTKSMGSDTNYDDCTYTETIPWYCDLFVHHVTASADDKICGYYYATVSYKYKVLYAHKTGEQSPFGDFYVFHADYVSDPQDVWYGNDWTNKHGGIYVHITGAFMRRVKFLTYVKGNGDRTKFFCQPQPATDNNAVNYNDESSWNIDVGITGGYKKEDGKNNGGIGGHFDWGYSNRSSVSTTITDVSITNCSSANYKGQYGDAAGWELVFGNLPKPKGDVGFDRNCPQSAYSYVTIPTQWVWNSGSHDEKDTKSIGNLVTEISPVLGAVHNGYCVTGETNTWELPTQCSETSMAIPNRYSFGTISVTNDLGNDYVMHDVLVTTSVDGESITAYHSDSDIQNGKSFECNLATGKYAMSILVYDKLKDADTKYVLKHDSCEVSKRISKDDIKVIDFTRNFTQEVQ